MSAWSNLEPHGWVCSDFTHELHTGAVVQQTPRLSKRVAHCPGFLLGLIGCFSVAQDHLLENGRAKPQAKSKNCIASLCCLFSLALNPLDRCLVKLFELFFDIKGLFCGPAHLLNNTKMRAVIGQQEGGCLTVLTQIFVRFGDAVDGLYRIGIDVRHLISKVGICPQ